MKKRFLMDTQAFLFSIQKGCSLSNKAKLALLDRDNSLHLSLISMWEMQIKISLGKLKLPLSLKEVIQKAVYEMGIELLPLQPEHIYQLGNLPRHDGDPFDRLLIAQALCDNMTIIGNDRTFDLYQAPRIW